MTPVTGPEWPPYSTVPEMIRWCTDHYGDAELVVSDALRLTYAEADARSARLAAELVSLGVGIGTRVGLLAPTSPEWVVAWMAVNRIGAVLVPINTFVRESELVWFLRHADVHTLLLRPRFLTHDYLGALDHALGGLPPAGTPIRSVELPALRAVVSLDPECEVESVHRAGSLDASLPTGYLTALEDAVAPAHPAVIMYSSGSTAEPKGALHPHATVVRHPYQVNRRRGLTPDDRVYIVMPFFWVGGFQHGLLAAYGAGACMVTDETFDVARAVEAIERERVTVVFCWPQQAAAITAEPTFASRDVRSLRRGSRNMVLPPGQQEDPTHRSNWLGMSETFGAHVIGPMDEVLPPAKWGSFGPAVPGMEHRIVDPETGEPCPPGVDGVLHVRGYALMTDRVRALREDVFTPDGWYVTGDIGHFDEDGWFFFRGRGDDVIKAKGTNVSPAEVEAVLRELDGVADAHVVGVEDPEWGEAVAAVVVPREGVTVTEDDVLAFLRPRLSAYKLPRHVLVRDAAWVPMTATGKVRRGVLREQATAELADAGDERRG